MENQIMKGLWAGFNKKACKIEGCVIGFIRVSKTQDISGVVVKTTQLNSVIISNAFKLNAKAGTPVTVTYAVGENKKYIATNIEFEKPEEGGKEKENGTSQSINQLNKVSR